MWRAVIAYAVLSPVFCCASSAHQALDLDALGLPRVDADALMTEVNRLAGELRAEAERLVAQEGADGAITRLRAEAKADATAAFQRLNLAMVVAALAGDDQGAADVIASKTPAATDEELTLALARHSLLIDARAEAGREASAGDLAWQGGQAKTHEEALARYARILTGVHRLAPGSPDVATCLGSVGEVQYQRGDLDAVMYCCQRSLEIRERVEPDSLSVASTLNDIGAVYCARGDLDEALSYLGRSLEIKERLAPDSLDLAATVNNVGMVYRELGELDKALECFERGLALQKRIAPDSVDVAHGLGYVGSLHMMRGDLDAALEYLKRSLEIRERLVPDSLAVADCLNVISAVHMDRGDLDAALGCYQRSLEIQDRIAPGSPAAANTLNDLGVVCMDRGDPEAALDYYERSLAIQEHLSPGCLAVARVLSNIGSVYGDRGDLDAALEYHQRSAEIADRVAPGSVLAATCWHNVGYAHQDRGDLDAALECYERCMGILDRVSPESACCADSRASLGRIAELKGDLLEARRLYEQACATIETAREKSGSEAEARAKFSAQYTYIYQHLIRVLLKLGETEGAADTAERMRAQGLREQLLARAVQASVDPAWADRQTALDAGRSRLYDELRGIGRPVPDEARCAEITAQLSRMRLEQESLTREIRAADPRYADLAYPSAMGVGEIADSLTAGTVVISYVVGDDLTWLFTFGAGVELRATEIPVSGEQLGERVGAYLGAIRAREDTGAASAELGELLLAPVADVLSRAQRALVLPDGPLWALPFQALTVDGRPLCEATPCHYAPSATVYVQERHHREQARSRERLLALGDPEFAMRGDPGDDRAVYMPIRGGAFEATQPSGGRLGFAPIPFSGVEASLIDTAFRPESDLRQGLLATEKAVRENGPGRRVIHLATHGLIDPLSPMDSAVVLSPGPKRDAFDNDGFLKAWEVFGLKLDGCDLVTLSACETARGKVLSGEGVIGLTRAFLYAGSASVLCTQWSVADDSTAALMVRFYTHYREGDAKDVALQEAMREIRSGKFEDGSPLELPDPLAWREEWSHPYYWAPFILVGEWQQTGVEGE